MDGAGDGLVETSDRMELGSVSHLLGLMQDLAGEDGQPSESYQLVQIMEVAVDLTPQELMEVLASSPDAAKDAESLGGHFRWRMLSSVILLLDAACETGSVSMIASDVTGVTSLLLELSRRGIKPYCPDLLHTICMQVGDSYGPLQHIPLEGQAQILSCLAALSYQAPATAIIPILENLRLAILSSSNSSSTGNTATSALATTLQALTSFFPELGPAMTNIRLVLPALAKACGSRINSLGAAPIALLCSTCMLYGHQLGGSLSQAILTTAAGHLANRSDEADGDRALWARAAGLALGAQIIEEQEASGTTLGMTRGSTSGSTSVAAAVADLLPDLVEAVLGAAPHGQDSQPAMAFFRSLEEGVVQQSEERGGSCWEASDLLVSTASCVSNAVDKCNSDVLATAVQCFASLGLGTGEPMQLLLASLGSQMEDLIPPAWWSAAIASTNLHYSLQSFLSTDSCAARLVSSPELLTQLPAHALIRLLVAYQWAASPSSASNDSNDIGTSNDSDDSYDRSTSNDSDSNDRSPSYAAGHQIWVQALAALSDLQGSKDPVCWSLNGHQGMELLRMLLAVEREQRQGSFSAAASYGSSSSGAEEKVGASASSSSGAEKKVSGRSHKEVLQGALDVSYIAVAEHAASLPSATIVGLFNLLSKRYGVRAAASPSRLRLLKAISLVAWHRIPTLTPVNMVELAVACGQMSWRPGLLLRDMSHRMIQSGALQGGLPLEQMVWYVWGLVKAGFRSKPAKALVSRCLAYALELSSYENQWQSAQPRWRPAEDSSSSSSGDDADEGAELAEEEAVEKVTAQQLALLVWASGHLGYKSENLLRPVVQLIVRPPGDGREQPVLPLGVVSNIVWACARLDGFAADTKLCEWAVEQAMRGGMTKAKPQEMAILLWSLSKLSFRPKPALLELVALTSRVYMKSFKPGELLALLSSFSKWEARPGPAFTSAAVMRVHSVLEQTDAEALCGITWALTEMGHKFSPDTIEAFAVRMQHALGLSNNSTTTTTSGTTSGTTANTSRTTSPSQAGRGGFLIQSGSSYSSYSSARQLPASAARQAIRINIVLGRFLKVCAMNGVRPRQLLAAYVQHLKQEFILCPPPRDSSDARCLKGSASARTGSSLPATPSEEDEVRISSSSSRGSSSSREGESSNRMGSAGTGSTGSSSSSTGLDSTRGGAEGREGSEGSVGSTVSGAPGRSRGRQLSAKGGDWRLWSQGISAAASGLSCHPLEPPGVGRELARAIELESMSRPGLFKPADLARLLYGLAQMGHCPQRWWATGGLNRFVARAVSCLTLSELSQLMWALSQWPLVTMLGHGKAKNMVEGCIIPRLEMLLDSKSFHADSARATGKPEPALPSATVIADLAVALAGLNVYKAGLIDKVYSLSCGVGTSCGGMDDDGEDEAVQIVRSAMPLHYLIVPPGSSTALKRFPVSQLCALTWAIGTLKYDNDELLEVYRQALLPLPESEDPRELGQSSTVGTSSAGGREDQDPAGTTTGNQEGDDSAKISARTKSPASASTSTRDRSPTSSTESTAEPGEVDDSQLETTLARVAQAGPASFSKALPQRPKEEQDRRRYGGAVYWGVQGVVKVLWAHAKLNRHPGPDVLDEALHQWCAATQGYLPPLADGGSRPLRSFPTPHPSPGPAQLKELTVVLYSLALLLEHSCPLAQVVSRQLAECNAPQDLRNHPSFQGQARQIAAALLSAQSERAETPLDLDLSPETRAAAIECWRGHVAARAESEPNGFQVEMLALAQRMGLAAEVNALTPDRAVCIDLLLRLPEGAGEGASAVKFALELVGPHNTAANSFRILGDAALKYRLLQARGYLVVPIKCLEWGKMGKDPLSKMVYLQNKLDKRLAAIETTVAQDGQSSQDGQAPPSGDGELAEQ